MKKTIHFTITIKSTLTVLILTLSILYSGQVVYAQTNPEATNSAQTPQPTPDPSPTSTPPIPDPSPVLPPVIVVANPPQSTPSATPLPTPVVTPSPSLPPEATSSATLKPSVEPTPTPNALGGMSKTSPTPQPDPTQEPLTPTPSPSPTAEPQISPVVETTEKQDQPPVDFVQLARDTFTAITNPVNELNQVFKQQSQSNSLRLLLLTSVGSLVSFGLYILRNQFPV